MNEESIQTDCCDREVDSHINHFLDSLHERLGLDKVMALTLDDPRAALQTLLEARAALEKERKTAHTLIKLKAAEHAASGALEGMRAQYSAVRYSELV